MSVRATEAVWTHSRLPRTEAAFLLLLVIAERAGADGIAWPGRDDLRTRLQVTDRHVRRSVEKATQAGELEQQVAADGRVVFRLVLPGLDAVDIPRLRAHGLELAEPFGSDTQVRKRRTRRSAKKDTQVRKSDVGVRPTRARASSRTVSEPSASGGSTPDGATDSAQSLVAYYVDQVRRRGAEPLSRLTTRIGREAKELLADGASVDEVRAGLDVVVAKGLQPSALAGCVQEHRLRTSGSKGGTSGRHAAYDAGL